MAGPFHLSGPWRHGGPPRAHLGALHDSPPAAHTTPIGQAGLSTQLPGHPELAQPAIERVDVRLIRRLTGEFASDFWDSTLRLGNVAGTDLGHMFSLDGRLYVVFGDTYGPKFSFPPGTTDPPPPKDQADWDWRSNTMAVIGDPSQFPLAGMNGATMITDREGHAKELIARDQQPSDGPGEVTRIPTNGIAIDGRMFLHFMSVRQWLDDPGKWVTNYSMLAFSDDGGWRWERMEFVWWASTSNFAQVAFVRDGDQVYLFGIPSGRFGGVKLARVPADPDALLNPDAYRYYRGGDQPAWVQGEGDATTIVPGQVGELSVMFNQYLGRWIMLHIQQQGFVVPGDPRFTGKEAIVVREAPRLTGPWSQPKGVCSGTGVYGSYMHPLLVRNGGEIVYFTMSRWDDGQDMGIAYDKPYNVYLMEARFTKR